MIQFLEFLDGIFSLIFVIVSIIVGIKILSVYITHKIKVYIFVGITWIGMACAYLPPAINFVMLITLNVPFDQFLYLSIYGFLPIAVLSWMFAMTQLFSLKEKLIKVIRVITLIFCIFLMTIYFYFLISDPALIGTFINPFIVQFTLFARLYFIFCIFSVLLLGIAFGIKSIRSDNPEIKLKGKFLLIAFISFTIAALLTSSVPKMTTKVIARVILVTSSIEFYLGFELPERIKKYLIQTN